jgi:hypothetical protein
MSNPAALRQAWLALVAEMNKASTKFNKAEKALNAAANGDEGALPYETALALRNLARDQHGAAVTAANAAWEASEKAAIAQHQPIFA